MSCDGPPVTYFSPEFENNYENGTPGTFQTFSFGSNVCVMSSVYFVGWGGEESNTGMKTAYPLVLGTNLAMKPVLRNAVLDDNILFLLSLC